MFRVFVAAVTEVTVITSEFSDPQAPSRYLPAVKPVTSPTTIAVTPLDSVVVVVENGIWAVRERLSACSVIMVLCG